MLGLCAYRHHPKTRVTPIPLLNLIMTRPVPTLAAASTLTFVLGSIHAFSVFVEPWENHLGASRADVSLTYSSALIALTASVLLGHRVFPVMRPPALAFAICFCAATGAVIAGNASTLPMLWFGYGLLFGGANGLGYGFALQIAAQAMPERKGLAMGTVTAVYAAGATVFSAAFKLVLDRGDLAGAMYFCSRAGFNNILTFDMGGTSTDVALIQNGRARVRRETFVGDVKVRAPSVDVRSVGAGGGKAASQARWMARR